MPGSDRVTEMLRPPLSYRITPAQRLAIDAAAALLGAVVWIFHLRLYGPHAQVAAPQLAVLFGAATLPVAVRRIWPLPALAVVTAAVSVLVALGRSPEIADVMLAMVSYMAAVRLSRSAGLAALVGTEAAIGAGVLAALATARTHDLLLHSSMLTAAAFWFIGYGVRERRLYEAGVAEQEAQRRRAEADRNRMAVQEERLRIARELHDILAHTLSVFAVQAGVGRRVGTSRPPEALRALSAVEESSRAALDELRHIVGLLRGDGGSDPAGSGPVLGFGGPRGGASPEPVLAPAPGLADLGDLAAMVRAAGTPVTLDVAGEASAVPPGVALTVYRIVQEALTNVVRHAPGAQATVQVLVGRAGVRVRVTDTGPAADATAVPAGQPGWAGRQGPAGQHGIVGMRERAAAFGGELDAGPLPVGGFQVAAFLPAPGSRQAA
jgi:signal transduction histidine kinase